MLRPLTIAPRDLELLGGGGCTTMKALLAAQFSRRVLQVIAVLDTARRTAPGAMRVLEASYALLSDVQQTQPSLLEEMLTLPCTGNWAAACLRGDAGDDAYGYLACLAASAAFRAHREFRIEAPVLNGTVHLPTLGTLSVHGAGVRSVTISGEQERLAVAPGTGIPALPGNLRVPAPGWKPALLLRAAADGCELGVWLDDSGPFRAPPGPRLKAALAAKEAAGWQSMLDQAWRSLVRRHRAHADGMSIGLRALIPLKERDDSGSDSATATNAAGGVLLTWPQHPENFTLTLIHEFQHTKLAAIEHVAALHKSDRRKRYHVRWRPDPRPLGAVLHGAYAHLGVADYWDSVLRLGGIYPDDVAQKELTHWCSAVEQALDLITHSGELTAAGDHFINGMVTALSRFQVLTARTAY
jgi:HEXXH motif-containing protein